MLKLKNKLLSVIIIAALLTFMSAFPSNALVLYTDGSFTFADIDSNSVALYSYDNSSPTLIIPKEFNKRYVRSIYDYAFENNTIITKLDFSENSQWLYTIGTSSFAGCENLSGELVLPSSIDTIGNSAFQGCSKISVARINANVYDIPSQCFNRCTGLKSVYLPITARNVDRLSFANCTNLEDVYFPESVSSINESAFLNSDKVVFHCFYDSYSYNYAKQNNIPYELLDSYSLGDANCDGNVDIIDVTRIQKYRAEIIDLNDLELKNADVNGDGEVTIRDATLIQMYCAGKITKFN